MQCFRSMYDDETDATYERAGFGAQVERGSRPGIVVVDLSRGFTEQRFPTGSDLTAVVEANVALIAAARAIAAPVLYTTIAFDEADVNGACAWLRKAPGLGVLREGSELVEIDPRLPREPGDPLVVKRGASAFFGTSLAATLVALGVDTVIVTGAVTSGCVRATAVDAVQSGFPVLVPREAVGDRAQGPHEANLFDIQAKYGDVLPVAEVLAYLSSLTPTETRRR
jgi:nicotinamidase-related amidase